MMRIKNRLSTRGAKGFLNLQRQLRILDNDNDGLINIHELRKGIRDLRIELTDTEIDLVFQFFDRAKTGKIDYYAFVSVLKGELTQ